MKANYPYISRLVQNKLKEIFELFPVVVISGARQVGKSTLLENVFDKHIQRIVFDPLMDVENAKQDPDLFLKTHRTPLILDEIQYAPEIISSIKRRLDKDRTPGQYLITGSQQWGIIKDLSESLAGRAVFLDLDGFCLNELSQRAPKTTWLEKWLSGRMDFEHLSLKNNLFEQIWTGFLPETNFLPKKYLHTFFQSYVRTYIERDVRQMSEINDFTLFTRFYKLCSCLSAQEINYNEIGRDIGVTPQTASRWLSLLKASFQWFEISSYQGNTIKRISEKPKGYFHDTGLICWALAVSSPQAISSHPSLGALFETFVVNDIRKQCQALSTKPNLYHWRSHGGAEVDLIIEMDGIFYPIEIKAKSHPTKKDTRGITAFRKTYPNLNIGKGLVVAPADSFYAINSNDYVLFYDAC
jgi:uncharacterized protein